ncbi:MAG: DUF4330 family protein [Bacteroidetes bacterium]|nr:DUF4330 family protein [Bacteroidota bacterium]
MANWLMDEKGRLFGKINIIDFLVLLFLLSLTPMFYFGWKIYTKSQVVLPPLMTEQSKYEKEYQEKIRLQQKISDFLKEHKRARKYFK